MTSDLSKKYDETTIEESESGILRVYGRNVHNKWEGIGSTPSKSEAINIAMEWGTLITSPVSIGEYYEYDLEPSEPMLADNRPGKQKVRIADVTAAGVCFDFKAGVYWLPSRAIPHGCVNSLFLRKNMSKSEPEAVEVSAVVVEDDSGILPDKDVLIECIKSSGGAFTSELAKCIGKPVAAANSMLSTLKKTGLIDNSKEENGLKWFLKV